MTLVPVGGNFHFQSKSGSYHYVKKSGYLVKSPTRIGRWRKRWFMLVDSVEPGLLTGTPERQIRLEYFSVAPLKMKILREVPKRKGMIDLRSCIAVISNDDRIKGYTNIVNIVMNSFRVHHLVADSPQERDDWLLALKEFVFSKPTEAQNYFTKAKVTTSVYADFVTSSYYKRSKDDQFLSSYKEKEGQPMHKSNAESDGEGPPPILVTRNQFGRTESLKRTLSRHAMCTKEEKRKSFKNRQTSLHEDPEETGGLLQIQLSNWNMTMISRSTIKTGESITAGGFSATSHGVWQKSPGEQLKVIVKTALKDPTFIMKEGLTIWQLMHPNIIMLVGAVLVDNPKLIVIEFCDKGTLLTVLQENGRNLVSGASKSSEMKPTLLKYCKQISMGLSYLKGKEIVHGAVKAENILVTAEDICKISGFGESLKVKDGRLLQLYPDFEVPIEWTAPEAYSSRSYSAASDIWSFGMVLYEVWSLGSHPYKTMAKKEIIPWLTENHRLPPPPGIPKDIYRLMIELWHPDPEKRPAVESVVTFLVMPEEDLLHMNQLPKKSSQKAHIAHTLGAPIQSGEILYRDLQLTYIGFVDQTEGKTASEGFRNSKQMSVESNGGYVKVGDIPGSQSIKKSSSTDNLTEEEKEEEENDLYWNDLYWKGPLVQDTENFSPEASSEDSHTEESDIYWNDGLLPPASPNTAMLLNIKKAEFQITSCENEEDDLCKRNERSSCQESAKLHKVHTHSLRKLWNVTNISSSEDEDAQVSRREGTKKLSKHVSVSRVPTTATAGKTTSVDTDSKPVLLPKPHLSDRSKATNRNRCLSTPLLLATNEKELSSTYYNAATVEIASSIHAKDCLSYQSKTLSPPKNSAPPLEASKNLSKSCNVTYANLEMLMGDELSENGNVNESMHYQNPSVLRTELCTESQQNVGGGQGVHPVPLDHPCSENPSRIGQVNEYYNSSASLLMSAPDGRNKVEEAKSYYNAAAILQSLPFSKETKEVSHEYPAMMLVPLASAAKEKFQSSTSGYYNSSAVKLMGEETILRRNSVSQISPTLDRKVSSSSKPEVNKYYNLDFFTPDGEVSHAAAPTSAEMESTTSDNRMCGDIYANLTDPSPPTNFTLTEDVETELEESAREDVLELLRARARKHKNKSLPGSSDLPGSLHHTYTNLAETSPMLDPAKAQTIVHITPAYDSAPEKHRKPLPSVTSKSGLEEDHSSNNTTSVVVENLQTKTHSMKELDSPGNTMPEKRLNDSSTVGSDQGIKNVQKAERAINKPKVKEKPKQLSSRSHSPISPTFGSRPASRASPVISPSITPSPSPTLSPLVSPKRRNRKFFDPSTQTHYSSKPSTSDSGKAKGIPLSSTRSSTEVSDSASATSTTISKNAGHNIVKETSIKKLKDEHRMLDKSSSNPVISNKVAGEPQVAGHSQNKIQIVKVMSNPHMGSPGHPKARPSPPPKSNAAGVHVSAVRCGPPPLSKKPTHMSTPSLTGTTQLASQCQSSGTMTPPSRRISQNSPSGSSDNWQRHSKKPMIPPIFQQEHSRKNSYKDSIAPHLA